MQESTIEQQRDELAAILGLNEPVTEDVLQAAVADSTYAHHLLVCRGNAEYLDHLLANPPHVKSNGEIHSRTTLVRRAAESLVLWARTGFSTVSEETYRKRLDACSDCPHLKTPPENRSVLYRIAGAAATDRAVCRECGCVVTVKARRVSDTCPVAHASRPGINRWDEPIAQQ
jgi:hypothetical protein